MGMIRGQFLATYGKPSASDLRPHSFEGSVRLSQVCREIGNLPSAAAMRAEDNKGSSPALMPYTTGRRSFADRARPLAGMSVAKPEDPDVLDIDVGEPADEPVPAPGYGDAALDRIADDVQKMQAEADAAPVAAREVAERAEAQGYRTHYKWGVDAATGFEVNSVGTFALVEQLKQTIKAMQEQHDEQLAALNARLANTQAVRDLLGKRIGALCRERDDLRASRDAAVAANSEAQAALATLRGEVAVLRAFAHAAAQP